MDAFATVFETMVLSLTAVTFSALTALIVLDARADRKAAARSQSAANLPASAAVRRIRPRATRTTDHNDFNEHQKAA